MEKTTHQLKKFEHHSELFAWARPARSRAPRRRPRPRSHPLPPPALTLNPNSHSFSSYAIRPTSLAPRRRHRVRPARLAVSPLRSRATRRARAIRRPRACWTSSLHPSPRRAGASKRVLFTLGVGLLFVALARPQAGFEWQETHRKGLELLFAVDTSKSMLAQDVKPDRLTRAKLAVHRSRREAQWRRRGPGRLCRQRLSAMPGDARLRRFPRIARRARYEHHSRAAARTSPRRFTNPKLSSRRARRRRKSSSSSPMAKISAAKASLRRRKRRRTA